MSFYFVWISPIKNGFQQLQQIQFQQFSCRQTFLPSTERSTSGGNFNLQQHCIEVLKIKFSPETQISFPTHLSSEGMKETQKDPYACGCSRVKIFCLLPPWERENKAGTRQVPCFSAYVSLMCTRALWISLTILWYHSEPYLPTGFCTYKASSWL